jgi:hypothetical protein
MHCGKIGLPPRSPSQRHLFRLYTVQMQFSLPHWGFPSENLLQEQEAEPNDMQRRINQLIHTQQMREQVYNRSQLHQERMKKPLTSVLSKEEFQVGDLVLRWDARNEDKGKHMKISTTFGWVHSKSVHVLRE